MFTKKKCENTALDQAIDDAIRFLDPNSDDYLKTIEAVERLQKLKESQDPKPLSRDTVAMIGGHLVGILMILGYERANVITTKALNFIPKLR